ncbi:hypothetical protein VMCG_06230 [Cytospora schulzeri]|uniref:Uncharacterized protein n=1 Tax=Cytospora schulzeri TaxID=448051 RepID=A0A423W9B5_9PEZI|nr:hypothetical protein VMCG_06230 [Valsa malicola]
MNDPPIENLSGPLILLRFLARLIHVVSTIGESLETDILHMVFRLQQPSATSFRIFPSRSRPQACWDNACPLTTSLRLPAELGLQLYHIWGLLALILVPFLARSERRKLARGIESCQSTAALLTAPLMGHSWPVALLVAFIRMWLFTALNYTALDQLCAYGHLGYFTLATMQAQTLV